LESPQWLWIAFSERWNKLENPLGIIDVLIKSAGVPIGRYSGEMVERLKDIDARWNTLRQIRGSVALAKNKDPAMTEIVNAPNANIYVVDVSFKALQDKSERDYLNQLPTSFHLPDEAIDRLRAAARTLILHSPDLQHALSDEGTRAVGRSVTATTALSATVTTPTAAIQAK
jgi:NTE family protein